MRIRQVVIFIFSAVFLLTGALAENVILTGTGGTFPYPLYAQWAAVYQTLTGTSIKYKPTSSTIGISSITEKKVDFGASDKPLTQAELQKNKLIQFPMTIGGIIPIVNLPNVQPGQLKLSASVFSDIYLGKIKKWNDPAILALNPGLVLPDLAISIVHRSDGSGTTFMLSYYLSQINPEWKKTVGSGTLITWPTVGIGVTSSEAVSITIKHTPGAIGCIEYSYGEKLIFVSLQNKEGNFISPSPAAFKAAADNANWKQAVHFAEILTNEPGKNSWPIVTATFVLLSEKQDDPTRTLALLKFFSWCYHSGTQMALNLNYVPLPESLTNLIESTWKNEIKDSHGISIWK